ncbi:MULTISPECIES: ExbD/TolR family protein [unclassified Coleofasciculus]|uniref:ExbD/TolR family protein n=1 Tax=unclassified Coleofasciculus TaxID=2692782 RepID=UPI001881080A|nr:MULTISPECIES: biopolymer transporter ExbD [unclassified Coleofasciculus]MBE9127081.1 biopolymer transporter ExbD [Coleofasciculus sp. LEGE 07081]MBE9150469.1 biopolymer transporter ExbD [Coleofasciculus sp. LEGE 07092]
MRLPDESESPFEINIVPMIDAIFSILAFFIISTLFLTRSEGLPVNLPTAITAEIQRQEQITVTINGNGQIFVNRQPIELSQIEGAVGSLVVPNSQSLVVINADARVPHGRVVSVMDRLRLVQGIRLAIAAERP